MKKSTLIAIALFAVIGLAKSQSITSPVACYPLDGNFKDASHGLDGTSAMTTFQLAPKGGTDSAVQFMGNGGRIKLPAVSKLQTQKLSISCWVNVSVTTTSFEIFSQTGLSTPNTAFSLIINPGNLMSRGVFQLNKNDKGNFMACQSGTFNRNAWSYVTSVFTGDSIKLFVNGAFASSAKYSFPIDYDTTDGLSIGSYYYNGLMNNLRIYDYALSANEINTLYINDPKCESISSGIQSSFGEYISPRIYPNPASEYINIKGATEVVLYNMEGQQVLKSQSMGQPINIGHLSKGMYWGDIKSNEGNFKEKIVIQ